MYKDLHDQIDLSNSYCLNEDSKFVFTNLFIGDETLCLKSDTDEQMILHIEFQEAVKIHSMYIKAPDDDTAPRLLKLYVNRNNMGFSDVNDIEPVQVITVEKNDTTENNINLRFVKFQRVKSLTIFIEENYGGDISILSSLKLFGESIQGTKVNDIKKVREE